MSFGYSISDSIIVVQLANKVRRRFVNSPAQFQAISDEVKCLSNLLRDLDDIVRDRSLTQKQAVDLKDNLHACKNLLNDLDVTLVKYQILDKNAATNLGAKSRRMWKRLKWEPVDVKELRARLASNTSLLNAFLGTIAISMTRATQASVDRVTSYQVEHRQRQILDWLSPDDFSVQQTDLFRRCKDGTGQWLLNSLEFKLWLRGERPTLFCPGIPGAGKTMLTSLIVHDLRETFAQDASVGIACIYCNIKRQADQMVDHLLASLLKGLLQGQTDFPQEVELLHQRHKSKGSRPSIIELSDTIKAITRDWSRIFLVIDALDECTGAGTRSRLLKEIASLQDHVNVSLLATSRFLPEVLEEFKGQLMLEIRATDGDVKTYITDRMTELPAFVQRNNMLQEKIVSEITAAVDGMFLLAKLNLDSLSDKMTVKAVEVALQELPKGSKALDSAYKEALQRIESQKLAFQQLAKSIMSWIVCARKQLTTPELRYALAIEDESSELDKDNLPDMSEVIAVCAGLVIIDEKSDVVHLVHYTAQDFFERTISIWAPFAEEMIAKSCLTYLSFGSVVESCSNFISRRRSTGVYDILCRDNVLVHYAAHFWGYHAEKCWTDSVERRVLSFLEDKKRVASCFEVNFDPRGPAIRGGRQVTAMHLLAYLGLPTAMSTLLRGGHSPDSKAVEGTTPLFYACCKGVGAVGGGQEDVVKLLLSQEGVDVNSMSKSRFTPLSMAAWYGREAIATSLLDHQGIQINIRNNLDQTPLIIALESGHSRIAQILLERASIEQLDVADGEESYLLDLATTKGNNTILRLLLQKHNTQVNHRADVRHIDHHGRTLVTKAVEAGNHETVNLLLHRAGIQLLRHDLTISIALIKTAKALFEGMANLAFRPETINLYVEDIGRRKIPMFSAKVRLGTVLNLSLKPNGIWVERGANNASDILLCAAWSGLKDAVAFLLRIKNIKLNFRDEVGRTALMLASESGQQAVVAMLLEESDVQTNCTDQYARTALMLAAEKGHEGILAMLLKKDDIDINLRDLYDRNALILAVGSGYPGAVAMLLENPDVRTNCKDQFARTALMLAAEKGHEGILAMLLKKDDIDINLRDMYDRNALMLAAASGYPGAVAMLLGSSDVQTNCKDMMARTALMLAAKLGHADVVNQLLAKDDVLRDCKDLQGRTALSLAARGEHKNVLGLLFMERLVSKRAKRKRLG